MTNKPESASLREKFIFESAQKGATLEHTMIVANAIEQDGEPVADFIEDSAAVGGARFRLLKLLKVGTKLYTHPATDAAKDARFDITRPAPVFDDLSERLKVIGNEFTADTDLRGRLHELALSIKVLGRSAASVAAARIVELEANATVMEGLLEVAEQITIENNEFRQQIADANAYNQTRTDELAASVRQCAEQGARLVAADTPALADVRAERLRQVSAEGWTPDHDDEHACGELASAAACYAAFTAAYPAGDPPRFWPWERTWWKPSDDKRRNLVKAGALILAEIERLDRAAIASTGGKP